MASNAPSSQSASQKPDGHDLNESQRARVMSHLDERAISVVKLQKIPAAKRPPRERSDDDGHSTDPVRVYLREMG